MDATTTRICLTRKLGEKLVMNGPCVVEVARVVGKTVHLRVEAESHVRVLREELLKAKEPGPDDPTDIIRPDELEDGE